MKLLAILLSTIALASAEGINCNGNGNCAGTLCSLTTIHSEVLQLPDGNLYNPGQHIACCGDPNVASGICAFTQNVGVQVSGSDVKKWVQDLLDHGCGKCGSVPTDFPNTNNVNNGELTVNWVSQR